MIPSACRVEACQPWRRGDPPCRGSCRASSRTARGGWGSREGGGEVRRARRWFDGVEGSRPDRGRGGGAIFCARRAGGAGWVWSRHDAGRAERGGRTEGVRATRGAYRSGGVSKPRLAGGHLLERRHGARARGGILLPLSSPEHARGRGRDRCARPRRAPSAREFSRRRPDAPRGVLVRDATTPCARASSL